MLGNLILYLKKFLKQQTCIHEYKSTYRLDNGNSFWVCEKCERLKE